MQDIVFVTHNRGKVFSAQKYFDGIRLVTFDYELDEPRSDDLKAIATAKVQQAYALVGKPCFALDTGFYIDALNGFPRAFVNFALGTIGVAGLLKLMEGKEDRACCFRECLAYHDGAQIRYFYGQHPGTLAEAIVGSDHAEKWSDLWYVFKPRNFDRTLSQMTAEEIENRRDIDGSVSSIQEFAAWYKQNATD